jgi:hypothetical protein
MPKKYKILKISQESFVIILEVYRITEKFSIRKKGSRYYTLMLQGFCGSVCGLEKI